MQLLNYYMPRLKKQFIFYPVIAVVLYLLIFVTLRWEGVIIIGAMVSNILNLMLVFGALIFASRSGMEIDTALPLTGGRKPRSSCFTRLSRYRCLSQCRW